MKSLLTALLCAALTAGCYPTTAPPPDKLVVADQAENTKLAEGYDLFMGECRMCHGYPDLVHVPAERWPKITRRMGAKANLEAAQIDTLLHFIMAARARLVERAQLQDPQAPQ